MTTRVVCLLALLAGSTVVDCSHPAGADPEADEIDEALFRETWLLTSTEVSQYISAANSIKSRGGDLSIGPDGALKPQTTSHCKNGPATAVFTELDTWYYPIPQFKQCRGLYCSDDSNCIAGNIYLRKFYTISYKLFNCWGIKLWIPIGIKRLYLFDETLCECKPACTPFSCFPPRWFNQKSCDCECPYIKCYAPYELDRSSCQCRCPKDIICRPPYKLDQSTCKCVCDVTCDPEYRPDPKQNCKCVPICNRVCPTGAYLDQKRCKCIGDCSDFKNEYDCTQVDSCADFQDQKCKWDPTYPTNPCQCDCCQPKELYSSYDCTRFTGLGMFGCNFHLNQATSARPCTWACTQ